MPVMKTPNSDQFDFCNSWYTYNHFLFSIDCRWENITVSLVKNVSEEGVREWWVLNQLGKRYKTSEESLELFIFSDKVSPPSLGFLAGYG